MLPLDNKVEEEDDESRWDHGTDEKCPSLMDHLEKRERGTPPSKAPAPRGRNRYIRLQGERVRHLDRVGDLIMGNKGRWGCHDGWHVHDFFLACLTRDCMAPKLLQESNWRCSSSDSSTNTNSECQIVNSYIHVFHTVGIH